MHAEAGGGHNADVAAAHDYNLQGLAQSESTVNDKLLLPLLSNHAKKVTAEPLC